MTKEISDILIALKEAQQMGQQTALATVVHVNGSSYRRPGARMLITEKGQLTGSISGGCLEGDALRKALHAIHTCKTMLVTYDTSDEDDAKFGMGLGCNGIIQVLIEPLQGENGLRIVDLLKKTQACRQSAALITLFSLADKKGAQPGSCFLLTNDGNKSGDIPFLPAVDIINEATLVIKKQQSSFKEYQVNGQNLVVFTEIILPAVSLVIIGGGNDVIPLVKIADIAGWQTTVVDGRPLYANKERFQTPACQVLLSKAEDVLQHITIDNRTVFVLMSHNYNYDLAMLKELLKKPVVYIGILGPRKKMAMMFEELEAEGISLTPQQRHTIYGPVGLNIGAETAEEIALSIVSEIKSVLSSSNPVSLRDKHETIHNRFELAIEKANSK
jgi:xanthine/CO dehydrogenase XdhC/CoxF family maturation factor